MGNVLLTKNKNSMPKRLSTIGLHGDIKNGSIPTDNANTIVLFCLAEHSQKLMGDDSVQGRYGHHGYNKGEKGIHLVMGTKEQQKTVVSSVTDFVTALTSQLII